MKKMNLFTGMLLSSTLLLPIASLFAAETSAATNAKTSTETSAVAKSNVTAETKVLELELYKLMPGAKPSSIEETPIPGLYEVSYGSEIFYFNQNASIMIKGDMVDMKNRENLTENKRATARVALIEAMGEENMIVYPAPNEKHKITVFTDIDCPYCVKLHREMDKYHEKGITVRYMAYPRAGIGSPSYQKIVSVWCSEDKAKAMTDSKNGLKVEAKACDNPVSKQFSLGQVLGVRGTPAIFLADGSMLPGYVPAARLAAELNQAK